MRLTDGWHRVRAVTFTSPVEPIREDRGCSPRACFMVVLCRLLWTVCSINAFISVEENKPPNRKLSSPPATLSASGRAGFQPVVPLRSPPFPGRELTQLPGLLAQSQPPVSPPVLRQAFPSAPSHSLLLWNETTFFFQVVACKFSGRSPLNCVPIERNTITL